MFSHTHFWGFSILLFLICFFRYFTILISVDYQCVMNNQQDSKNKEMLNAYGLYYAYPVVNENHQRLRVSLRLLRLIICK